MDLDLINYLISGAVGFVLGLLIGVMWREVHQIKEVVVDQDGNEQPTTDEPDHKRRWRILGGFVIVVALGQIGYTAWWSDQQQDKTECLAQYVSDFSKINRVRSQIETQDRRAGLQHRRELLKLLQSIQSEEDSRQEFRAYANFLRDSVEDSEIRQTERAKNPLPVLGRRECR